MKSRITWADITLRQYNEVLAINESDANSTELYRAAKLLSIVTNKDVMSIPITELDFTPINGLNTELKPIKRIPNTIEVNGREYVLLTDYSKMTTAQFIDWDNYTKVKADIESLLSVFIVPKGHKYNDGDYDMNIVEQDILDLPIPTALGILNFLEASYLRLLRQTVIYSSLRILTLKTIPWRKRWRAMKDSLKAISVLSR